MKSMLILRFATFAITAFSFFAGEVAQTKIPDKAIFSINLLDDSNYPVVTVRINGLNNRFIIDTGSPHTILSHRVSKKLNLPNSGKKKLISGVLDKLHVVQLEDITLQVSGYKCTFQPLMATQKSIDNSVIFKEVFSKYDGILGLDFFSGTLLTIDGTNNLVRISTNPQSEQKNCKSNFITSTVRSFVNINIQGMDFDILADTGFTEHKLLHLFPRIKTSILGARVKKNFILVDLPRFGNLPLKQTIYPDVKIAENNREQIMVLFPDLADDKFGTTGDIDGLIGWKYLKHGVLGINLVSDTAVNADFVFHNNWDNRQNLSGMRENLTITPQAELVFSKVDKNSPAEKAGIQRSDKIIKINGQSISLAKLEDLKSALSGIKGSILVQYLRGDILVERKLVFNDYLLQNPPPLPNPIQLLPPEQ